MPLCKFGILKVQEYNQKDWTNWALELLHHSYSMFEKKKTNFLLFEKYLLFTILSRWIEIICWPIYHTNLVLFSGIGNDHAYDWEQYTCICHEFSKNLYHEKCMLVLEKKISSALILYTCI